MAQPASRDQTMQDLRSQAERLWGAERLPALEPALRQLASALWRLDQEPLELLDDEPDFTVGAMDRGDASSL